MLAVASVVMATLGTGALVSPAAGAPVGSGFTVNEADIAFILNQIKIAERHSATYDDIPNDPCGTLVGPGPAQVPDRLTTYGLRTVDGSCNNLFPGRETYAAADQVFPRLTEPDFRSAENVPQGFGPPGPSTYLGSGNVFDSQPRVASNLIVDQTSTNPAAVIAALNPVRSQSGDPSAVPCTTEPTDPQDPTSGLPAGCTPAHQTLFIPNITTDVGLSPPYNSWFTFFGQFFDHGVDQTVKSGSAVFVPMRADDPLIAGPDHIAGNADDLPARQRFMVLTRAQNQGGGQQDATNTDSPWVDQSQTYTSHSSHQVFLREYQLVGGRPVSTGMLLGGLPAGETYTGSPDGRDGLSTWASTKKQAAQKLGLLLEDKDVLNVPMLAADPYGNFIPGPARGLPQYVTLDNTLVEGDLTTPVPVPVNVRYFDTPFLTDIAHNADPSPKDTDNNPGTPAVTPQPDADNTPTADFAAQAPGTYDDEMLDAHFACGDGRCNENIALSTVHQVFHAEHDRIVDDITTTLAKPGNEALKASFSAPHVIAGVNEGADLSYGLGGRLFQAARFITEMEYQHLVFEEFARKVQPAVRVFRVYSPDMNPAVTAEFAHAVYRFGHSMLTDDVDRPGNSVPLLDAFLNPPEFFNGPGNTTYTPREAAGAVVMGAADQTGNELDEFVTETLRNNLLGLPLDLATVNMARAREAGVPRLNDLRRQIFARTNDGQLTPYEDWSDFGQHLKHPESLINFVAAYGTHPSITGAATLEAKRDAARAIVNPRRGDPTAIPPIEGDLPPEDAGDFMFGTGAWSDAGGVTTTGLDDVDLWVGGLAEVTNLFGGLLGSTFNYVFTTQMESLQDGDRFYYLARTPGMNLRAQLEGNSFSELIGRNTDGVSKLKADSFSTADCKFELGNLVSPATTGTISGPGSVQDDPESECNENLLLLKNGQRFEYRQRNSVDTRGLNAQAVYNGTTGVDVVQGGNDNDTFWGDDGDDVIKGEGGDDVALGGAGNDIITDLSGADVLKGGPGNDAIDSGPDDDITMGGDGQDFINGGAAAAGDVHFAGPGNDFVIGGQGADTVFGDSGDDWIQGGSGQDLLIGDHGAPFFDDPAQTAPGNDVFIGQVGENDYDAEGGDDIMSANAAVDRFAGAAGWDWAIHQYDTVGANDDMEINQNLGPLAIQVVVNRDRWQEMEGNSGSAFDDVILGQDDIPADVAGGGFSGCNALDQAGVDRIAGLGTLVTTFPRTAASLVAASAAGFCPLTGNVWGEGDILLGGGGSDTLTGRLGDDIIDGDKALTVRISVRTNPADPASEIGSTDLMEGKAVTGNFGIGTTNMTLQQAVFAGRVDPGNLVAVRETTSKGGAGDTDTAVFRGLRNAYIIAPIADGGFTVAGPDGVDTIRNIERLQFDDQTVTIAVPAAPTIGVAEALSASARVNWTAPPAPAGATPLTSYTIQVFTGTTLVRTVPDIPANATTSVVTGLTNGTPYTFQVAAVNQFGTGSFSASSNAVTPVVSTPPGAPTNVQRTAGNRSLNVTWTAPASDGGSPITSYEVQARVYVFGIFPVAVTPSTVVVGGATSAVVTGLTNAATYDVRVRALNAAGPGAYSPFTARVALPNVAPAPTVTSVPNAPAAPTAVAGARGGAITATATWTAATVPAGSPPVNGYVVRALRMNGNGTVAQTITSAVVPANSRTLSMTLPAGNYRFTVQANTATGASGQSARSNQVRAR